MRLSARQRGLLLLLIGAASAFADERDVYFVTHSQNAAELTPELLESAIHGRVRSWQTGEAIVVVLPGKKSPEQSAIAEQCFETSAAGLQREWLRLVFSGRANAPVYTDSPDQLAEHIKSTPGSIGVTLTPPQEGEFHIHEACR